MSWACFSRRAPRLGIPRLMLHDVWAHALAAHTFAAPTEATPHPSDGWDLPIRQIAALSRPSTRIWSSVIAGGGLTASRRKAATDCYKQPEDCHTSQGLSRMDLASLRMGHSPTLNVIETIIQRMKSSLPPGPTWDLFGPTDTALFLSPTTLRHTRLGFARRIRASSYTALVFHKDNHYLLVVLTNLPNRCGIDLFNPRPGHLEHHVHTQLARVLKEPFVELPLPWPRSWSIQDTEPTYHGWHPSDSAILTILNLSILILTTEGHLHPTPKTTREVRVHLLALLVGDPETPLPFFSYSDLAS